jgi:putative photosynthetic complex assembly protein
MSATTSPGRANPPFPRLQLAAVLAILGGVLIASAAARFTGYANTTDTQPVVASALLTFTDMPDGGVAVRQAGSGQIVSIIPARGGGFLRSTMRVLATERSREGMGPEKPFRLTELPGAKYQLTDTATGEQLELEAFGSSNVAEFASILATAEQQK